MKAAHSNPHHPVAVGATPPRERRGELVPPLLFKEGWHAQHDGVVSRPQPSSRSTKRFQPVQVRPSPIRCDTELLYRQTEPVNPISRIAESLCAGHIPARERDEYDLVAAYTECVDAHLIRAQIGFVGSHAVGAQV